MVSPEQEGIAKIVLRFLFNFNIRSFKDSGPRIVLNDKKTSQAFLTSWLKNYVGQEQAEGAGG
jgi:hypothetical protein